jgi:hypothetical protein
MCLAAPAAAKWKSSTTIAVPSGRPAASLAIEAITSADITPSIAKSSAASVPNPPATARGASMNPAQNRTGSASAPSHDSHAVDPAGRPAAQSASSTLLPAPADPTTTVSRLPAPPDNRPAKPPRATHVDGSPAGRNFATANRTPGEALPPVTTVITPGKHAGRVCGRVQGPRSS